MRTKYETIKPKKMKLDKTETFFITKIYTWTVRMNHRYLSNNHSAK